MSKMQIAAMFQDATPVAATPAGRSATSAIQASDKGGAFAQVLQGRRSPGADAEDGTKAGSESGDLAGSGALLRLATGHTKGPSAGLATEHRKVQRQAADGGTHDDPVQEADQSQLSDDEVVASAPSRQAAGAQPGFMPADPTQKGKDVAVAVGGELAKPAPGKTKGADGNIVWADLRRKSLAAEAQQNDLMVDLAKQGGEAAAADSTTAPGRTKGPDLEALFHGIKRETIPAAAQQTAAAVSAGQMGAASATVVMLAGNSQYSAVGTLGNRHELGGAEVTVTPAQAGQSVVSAAVQTDRFQGRLAETAVTGAEVVPAGSGAVATGEGKERVVPAGTGTVASQGQELSKAPTFTSATRQGSEPMPLKTALETPARETAAQVSETVTEAPLARTQSATATPATPAQGEAAQRTAAGEPATAMQRSFNQGSLAQRPGPVAATPPVQVAATREPVVVQAQATGATQATLVQAPSVQVPDAQPMAAQSTPVQASMVQETVKTVGITAQNPEQPATRQAAQAATTQAAATPAHATQSAAARHTDTPAPAAQAATAQELVAQESAAQATASQELVETEAQGSFRATLGSNVRPEGGAAAPVKRQGGQTADFVPTPVGKATFQGATPAKVAAQEMPKVDEHVAPPQSVEAPVAEVASKVGAATALPSDEARQASGSAGATEVAQKEVPTGVEKPQGPAMTRLAAEQQPVQTETVPADATPSLERGAQFATDRKDSRAAEGAQRPFAAEKGVVGQTGVTQKVSAEEASGTKTALTAVAAKFVPSQGGTGQGGSEDTGKKEHQEQKAQAGGSPQVSSMGFSMQAPASAEVAQPEAKAVNLKSALLESILNQVKDGTVTHGANGTSQVSIRLNPGELGELKIQVRMENNQVRVEVQADNKMVKDLLMSNLDSLKEALSSKNFTMEGFDVSTGGGFNSPLNEEKWNSPQQHVVRTAKAGGYDSGQEEARVNYLTADVNNLLDVRF